MIKMTTSTGADDGAEETFTDLEDLEEELHVSASPEYTSKVLTAFRNGETRVAVRNGQAIDVYELVNE